MSLPMIKQLAVGGARLVPAVVPVRANVSFEKADVELCGAAERSRPTAADHGAYGNRQVSNNCGHSRVGRFDNRNARNGCCGGLAVPGHDLPVAGCLSTGSNMRIADMRESSLAGTRFTRGRPRAGRVEFFYRLNPPRRYLRLRWSKRLRNIYSG
jgi:hypothetical protein